MLEEGAVVGPANHTVLLAADGNEYQIADSAAPIRDASGAIAGVILVFRDVTEEYAVQQTLHEREQEMKRAQKLARLGSWRFHLGNGTGTPSPEASRIYGLEEAEFSIARVQEIPLFRYREMLDNALHHLVHDRAPYDVEFEIRRPSDGAVRHVHSVAEYDPDENVVVGMIQDITERKQIEETLRAERARFSMIAELSPVGIVTVDAGGRITFANVSAERTLGLQRSEITSRTYDAPQWQHTSPDGGPFPDEEQPFTIVRSTLKPVYDVRHGITWPDGRHVELSINGSPILDSDGCFQGMITTIEDITERHYAERRVHSLFSEKELLLRDTLDDAARRVEAMTRIYDRLYRAQLSGNVNLRDFLSPLAREAGEVFASLVEVEAAVEGDDVIVDARVATSLGIVVNELITNSVKHGFEGRRRGSISIEISLTAARVGLTYRDDGIGRREHTAVASAKGFGEELITMIVESLQGTVQTVAANGMMVVVELPDDTVVDTRSELHDS